MHIGGKSNYVTSDPKQRPSGWPYIFNGRKLKVKNLGVDPQRPPVRRHVYSSLANIKGRGHVIMAFA